MVHERFSADSVMPPWVRHEHVARYAFASRFATGKSVIDCACGSGEGTEALASVANRVEAIDVSESAFADAQSRLESSNVQFQTADAAELPLASRSADLYVNFETIEHVEDDRRCVSEAVRVLNPDGLFICSTPNRAITNPGKAISDKPWNRFHLREYSSDEFAALLYRGFRHVEFYGQNPNRMWWSRLMGKLGRVLPCHGAVRINQVFKLPRFVWDNYESHGVRECETDIATFEYLIAVCSHPR